MWSLRKKLEIPTAEQCLPGRAIRMRVPDQHFVNGHRLAGPYPAGLERIVHAVRASLERRTVPVEALS